MLELDKLEESVYSEPMWIGNCSNPLLDMYRNSMEIRMRISMTQDTMIEHSIKSAVACAAVSLYTRFELQHAVTVSSLLAIHINCSCLSKRNKAVAIMSARSISWIGLLIVHPSRAVTVGAG